jgi:hypothetical protein
MWEKAAEGRPYTSPYFAVHRRRKTKHFVSSDIYTKLCHLPAIIPTDPQSPRSVLSYGAAKCGSRLLLPCPCWSLGRKFLLVRCNFLLVVKLHTYNQSYSVYRPHSYNSRPYRIIPIHASSLGGDAAQINILSFRPGRRRALAMAMGGRFF